MAQYYWWISPGRIFISIVQTVQYTCLCLTTRDGCLQPVQCYQSIGRPALVSYWQQPSLCPASVPSLYCMVRHLKSLEFPQPPTHLLGMESHSSGNSKFFREWKHAIKRSLVLMLCIHKYLLPLSKTKGWSQRLAVTSINEPWQMFILLFLDRIIIFNSSLDCCSIADVTAIPWLLPDQAGAGKLLYSGLPGVLCDQKKACPQEPSPTLVMLQQIFQMTSLTDTKAFDNSVMEH